MQDEKQSKSCNTVTSHERVSVIKSGYTSYNVYISSMQQQKMLITQKIQITQKRVDGKSLVIKILGKYCSIK